MLIVCVGCMGILLLLPSILSKINANFSKSFLFSFLASTLGTVGAGGFADIVMISSAACVIKS